jgi:gamma-glutamyltranspeptidase/glutathione hydrolase
MELAAGYPIDAETANSIERQKAHIKKWPYSTAVFLTHPGEKREAPETGEIFVQKDLLNTLTKLIETERATVEKRQDEKGSLSMRHTTDFIKVILQKSLYEVARSRED